MQIDRANREEIEQKLIGAPEKIGWISFHLLFVFLIATKLKEILGT